MRRRSTVLAAAWLGAVALGLGCVALLGWAADIPTLKSVLPGLVSMKVNTALCLALGGMALWLQAGEAPRAASLARAAAVVVGLVGGLTLGEHLFGWQLGIDELLVRDAPDAVGTSAPGRMAFTTAWAFLALGPVLFCLRLPQRWAAWVAQVLALAATMLGLLATVGYLYIGHDLYSVGLWSSMAVHTALAVVLLGLGSLLARPDYLLPSILTDRGPGGAVGRLLLPISVVAPVLCCWWWMRAQTEGLMRVGLGLAIVAVLCASAFGTVAAGLAHWLSIADRRRVAAEEALRESEGQLRELMRHASCGLWSGDIFAVPGGEQATEMADAFNWQVRLPQGAASDPWLDLVLSDEDLARKHAVGLQALRSGSEHYGQEFRCRNRDGEERWIHEAVTLRPAEPGHWQVFGVWLDVTERHAAGEALAEREAALRELTRGARCALWSGEVTIYERSDQPVVGWALRPQPDEQAAQALVPLEVPAGGTYVLALHDGVPEPYRSAKAVVGEAAALRGDPYYRQEFPVVDRHGVTHWLYEEVSLQPVGPDRYHAIGVWTDISELRRAADAMAAAERFWRATLDALSANICVLDEQGTILTVNAAWREFAAANPPVTANVHEGANYLAVCEQATGDDAEQAHTFAVGLREVMAGQRGELTMEYACHSPSQQRWFVGRAKRFGDGGQMRVVVSHTDITARVEAELKRASIEQHLRAQQRLEAVGTLASGVAHEINNPVMGVANYAQLILDDSLEGSEQAVFASEILHETSRIATIVRNLLAFSRADAQSHGPARLADIIADTLSLVRTVLRHDDVLLEVDVPDDLPAVDCRSQQVQQVLMNLVTNARDALNERYPGGHEDKRIRVTARSFDVDGQPWQRLTVEDHGPGVDEAVGARMWDPFYTTKPRDKGTGLGLSISHGIARDHHGRLWYECREGEWTRFHFELPAGPGGQA